MNLKEKLAEDYCIDREGGHAYVEHFRDGLNEGFVAGFEKAREMGVEIIEYYSHSTPCTDNFILCESACEGISQMKNLGEEEV